MGINQEIKDRSELIQPEHVDNIYLVHTGKEFKAVKISSNKVGRKFGEFAITKIPAKWKKHGKKR